MLSLYYTVYIGKDKRECEHSGHSPAMLRFQKPMHKMEVVELPLVHHDFDEQDLALQRALLKEALCQQIDELFALAKEL